MNKIKKNIYTFMEFNKNFNSSKIIYFGAPYDGTVSFRPGSRFGPKAIREFSYSLETYSPFLKKDLVLNSFVCDVGDLDLSVLKKKEVLNNIYKLTRKIIKKNKKIFMVGGEHLVSLPCVKAFFEKYNNLNVIHFDAHSDLRDIYYKEKLSHATVMKRIWEIIGENKIYQIGIRSGIKEEFDFAKKHSIKNNINITNINKIIKQIDKNPVYITFDLDVFDPSIIPGVGTPEPGGLNFKEIINILYNFKSLNIVGADVVELAPKYDNSDISTICACKIIRELILLMS